MLVVLQVCGRIALTGIVAYVAYFLAKDSGAVDLVACIAAVIACLLMIAAYTSFLSVMAWVLIVVIVLAIGFAVLTVVLTPPSLYSLVVIGLVLLAGILWQLTKLTSKP
jgi:hypothetical protein